MKRRHGEEVLEDALAGGVAELAEVLAALPAPELMQAFLEDLCTPAELEAMADRWRVVPLLAQGISYREIHDQTGVSVTTIGRVARTMERGAGGYSAALECSQSNVR
ncbi:YerC/YecD family TrpR-related protein [Marilutibacter alkalisoli]|uniref:DNA-binding transcriptional regulator n=1 Tax=Marilutibacter alkalisoli TaxID=2591633 RepID=A0A514BSQ3_9GAMM|nr:YerC/YecD family TrpR-related protein [Lysobacter alkalisoli]QDH70397.1 DNA-binding transcriptional regulator [Lysobacter alkalisoli]